MHVLAMENAPLSEVQIKKVSDEIASSIKKLMNGIHKFWQPGMGPVSEARTMRVYNEEYGSNNKAPDPHDDHSETRKQWEKSVTDLEAAIKKNDLLREENSALLAANRVLNKRKKNLIDGKEMSKEDAKKAEKTRERKIKKEGIYLPAALKLETKKNNLKTKKVNHHSENLQRQNKNLEQDNKILWSEIFLLKTQSPVDLKYIMDRAKGK